MIGEKKRVLKGNTLLRRVKFDGFSMREENGKLSFADGLNCDCKGGILRRGVGVAPYLDGDGNLFLVSYATGAYGVYPSAINEGEGEEDQPTWYFSGKNGYACRYNSDTGKIEKKKSLTGEIRYHSLKDNTGKIYHLISGGEEAHYSVDGDMYFQIFSGQIKDACVAGGRYFIASSGSKLYYGALYDPSNTAGGAEEGGQLLLPTEFGDIRNLEEQKGYLYILCERAICRLLVKPRASEFLLERVAYDGGEICAGSAVRTGEGIAFLALDGAYLLRGEKTEKICEELRIRPAEGGSVCRKGFADGLVLIEYEQLLKSETKEKRRVALYADGSGGFFTDDYGDLGGREFTLISGFMHRFARDSYLTIYSRTPVFKTGELDFGSEKIKTFKKLRLTGRGRVRVQVTCDGSTREYTLSFEKGIAQTRLLGKGRSIALEIALIEVAEVYSVEVDYLSEE